MEQKTIVCLVVVVAIIIVIVFLTSSADSFCNCTGMASRFDKAPYTFWRGSEFPLPYEARSGFDWQRGDAPFHSGRGWPTNPGMPYIAEQPYVNRESLGMAYTMDSDSMRDLYRDRADGLLDTSVNYAPLSNTAFQDRAAMRAELNSAYGAKAGGCDRIAAYTRGGTTFVPLAAVGGALPPGAVTSAKPYMGSLATRMRFGDGKYVEGAPIGTYRYGGYGTMAETCGIENAYGYATPSRRGSVGRYSDLSVGVL